MHGLDDTLKRTSVHEELEQIWAGVVSAHIASSLSGQHCLERSLCGEDRFTLGWPSNNFAPRINNVTVARGVNSVELAIALWDVLCQTQTAG
jgi:hypothetical protein